MNSPGKMHDLYQVYATEVKTGSLVPFPKFPRADKKAVDMWANVLTEQIRLGRVKDYKNPQVVLYLGPTENQLIGV